MPTAGAVTAHWASVKQHGLFIGSLTTFPQISNIFTNPVSGAVRIYLLYRKILTYFAKMRSNF